VDGDSRKFKIKTFELRMRLPNLIFNSRSVQSAFRLTGEPHWCAPQKHSNKNESNPFSLIEASQEPTKDDILACHRPTYFQTRNILFTKHCFLKYVNQDSGETLDSVSFSPNEPAGARDAKPDSGKAVCSSVKSDASEADWQAVKSYYQQNCRPERWREDYNCCTCASNAMTDALHVEPPLHILQSHFGVSDLNFLDNLTFGG
jgi:hypothetical protein